MDRGNNTNPQKSSEASNPAVSDARPIGVSPGQPVDMRMFPWLLPVSVAVVMLVFLVCSFFNHHRRFLQQRRHASRYYLHEYRRVAGPIFSLAATLGATPGVTAAGSGDGEQEDQPTSILTASALTKRLRRCYSWSPRIFKNKHPSGIRNITRLSTIRKPPPLDPRSSLESIVQSLVPNLPKSHEDPTLSAKILEEIQTLQKTTGVSEENLNAQFYALAHWASLSQSTGRKSRSLVVTTSSGSLAKDHRLSEPDVTSIGEQEFKIKTETLSNHPDGLAIKPTLDHVISEIHTVPTSINEYLESNFDEKGSYPSSWKSRDSFQRFVFPGSKFGAKSDSTNEIAANAADIVPMIQITPTMEEADAVSKSVLWGASTFNTDEKEQNNNDNVFLQDYNLNTNSRTPHVCSVNLPCTAANVSNLPTMHVNVPPTNHPNPKQCHLPIRAIHGSLKRAVACPNCRGSADSCQLVSDFDLYNSNPTQPENSTDTTIPGHVSIINSICELQGAIKTLHVTFGLGYGQSTQVSNELKTRYRGNNDADPTSVKLPLAVDVNKQRDRARNVLLNQTVDKNFSKVANVKSETSLNKDCFKDSDTQDCKETVFKTGLSTALCPQCETVRGVLGSLDLSSLQNIDQFLAQWIVPLQKQDLDANRSTPVARHETSWERSKRAGDDMNQPCCFSHDESFSIPLLSGRRRAASDSSTMPECRPLLRQDRNYLSVDKSRTLPSAIVGLEHCKTDKRHEIAITVETRNSLETDSVFADYGEQDQIESSKTVDNLIGYTSLPDSPKSIDTVEGYKDSSLTSLHESVV